MTVFSKSKSRASPFRNRHGSTAAANIFETVSTVQTSKKATKGEKQ